MGPGIWGHISYSNPGFRILGSRVSDTRLKSSPTDPRTAGRSSSGGRGVKRDAPVGRASPAPGPETLPRELPTPPALPCRPRCWGGRGGGQAALSSESLKRQTASLLTVPQRPVVLTHHLPPAWQLGVSDVAGEPLAASLRPGWHLTRTGSCCCHRCEGDLHWALNACSHSDTRGAPLGRRTGGI